MIQTKDIKKKRNKTIKLKIKSSIKNLAYAQFLLHYYNINIIWFIYMSSDRLTLCFCYQNNQVVIQTKILVYVMKKKCILV